MTNDGLPSKTVNVDRLPVDGETITINADGALLDILTANTAAEEILEFSATIDIKPWKQSGAIAHGTMSACIAQQCVASLDMMETRLEINFSRTFLPEGDPVFASEAIMDGELVVEPEGDDMPDLLDGNTIDIWPILLEELNLEIDPFPRKPGFEWQNEEATSDVETEDKVKPFADLKKMMSKKSSQSD